ncbi:MAG: SLC13 family permease [Syntrophales bacterium]|jgi:Na+/H+ antiporter NhaD/arsenite permease-like protein
MDIQLFTLIVLVAAIIIGFKTNINTGVISLGLAFIVGHFVAGLPFGKIIGGWPTKLFIMLMGMTFIFCIANVNGTLELLAKKVTRLAKGNNKLLPIIFFVLCAILSAVGPGPIVVPAIMLPIAMEIAKIDDIPDMLMATLVIAGSLAGGLSPLTPSGIVANTWTAQQGLDLSSNIFFSMLAAGTLMGVIYYVLFGGLKLKGVAKEQTELMNFNGKQKITLAVIGLVVCGIMFFKWDIGLTSLTGAAILLLIKASDQNKSIAAVPWATLIMVSGVAVLVNVVQLSGGIATLSKMLAALMNEITAAPIMAATGGLMSTASSAMGVVMPTLIPTVPGIVKHMGGTVTASSLITGIVVGAHVVTVSPFSTLGALAMASATDATDTNKFFTKLLITGMCGVPAAFLIGLLGFYR